MLKEFSGHPIPIEELEEFYRINKDEIPEDMPYSWLMFVMSGDGIGSLMEPSYRDPAIGLSGPGIALKHFRDKRPEAIGAYGDADTLQFGWAYADAVLAGSGVLRAEPFLTWLPWEKRFLEYRHSMGKDEPLRIVVTGSGFTAEEMERYPVLRPQGIRTLIATSEKGYGRMQDEIKSMDRGKRPTAEFKPFGEERVNFRLLLEAIRKRPYGIEYLDIQGGPDIAGQLFKEGLIHEYRITISPTIAGYLTSEGRQRPGPVKTNFGPDNLLTMPLIGLGVYGSHTFHRYKVNYQR